MRARLFDVSPSIFLFQYNLLALNIGHIQLSACTSIAWNNPVLTLNLFCILVRIVEFC